MVSDTGAGWQGARPGDDHPQVIADFDLQERIGEGASAVVYRAVNRTFGGVVAVKLWRAGLTETQRHKFLDECKLQWRLSDHPNIVRLYWADAPADGPPWLATELYETSLARRVLASPPLTLIEILDYSDDVLAGLIAVHNEGMLHRDVKPANVLLKGRTAALGDLGITMRSDAWTRDAAAGTEAFLAPELLRGEPPTFRSDVFSAAATIRSMFSHDIPPEIEAVLTRAASHNSADRPANAKVLREQLRAARDKVEERQGRESAGPVPWGPPAGLVPPGQVADASSGGRGPGIPGGRVADEGGTPPSPTGNAAPARSSRRVVIAVMATLAALAAMIGVGSFMAFGARSRSSETPASSSSAVVPSQTGSGASNASSSQFSIEKCTPEIRKSPQWVCLTNAVLSGNQLVLLYDSNFTPSAAINSHHMHLFTANYTDGGLNPPASVQGLQQQPESTQGYWWTDYSAKAFTLDITRPSDSPKHHAFNLQDEFVCIRVATQEHGLVQDAQGGYDTGNCIRITKA